jgi:ComF family protein
MSGRRIYLNIRHKLRRILNPALCQICGVPVSPDHYYCQCCWAEFKPVNNACLRCGLPNHASGDICPVCLHSPPPWQRMLAPLVYSGYMRDEIHRFKYSYQLEIAQTLLERLHAGFKSEKQIEALIPVPLHKSRVLQRGFNQSEEIARILSAYLNIPVDRYCVKRIRETQPQTGLSPSKRRNNIRRAFEYTPDKPYQSLAIIDDVITSGSTMSEICRILRRKGVKHIEVWSLARTLKNT